MRQSTFRMRPQTCIPGSRVLRDDKNEIVKDDSGNVQWQKPNPVGWVRHFKNEAVARKDANGLLIDLERDTVNHPVFKGMDKSYYRYLRSQARRQMRKFNITEITDDDNISNSDSGQHISEQHQADDTGVSVS